MTDETGRRPPAAGTSRRALLVMGGAGAASLVTGCAVYGGQSETPPQVPPPAAGDPTGGAPGGSSGETSTPLARTGDVPPGGGLIVGDLVITQPTDGEFRGFSATCTHQGCAVTSVSDGTINCPCHGSRFSIADGSVVQAAAGLTADQQAPLPEVAIRVDGDAIGPG